MAHPYQDDREYAPNQNSGAPYATSAYAEDGGGLSRPDTNDDGLGPDRLFSILEEAVPRPDETLLFTVEELQRRRELVEQTWDQVRRWLWAHESQEERAAAAYIRGQADVTPLHLMCKLNNPPTDIISDIVEAAPEVVSWVDSHGWLPLHHACANGASPDVLQVLSTAVPESKITQDNQNRTPLHFYATRNSDNPAAMAINVGLLSDTGAAELPDRGGMLPMHYACAYGTSPAVLKVLVQSYPESLLAKENKGRTPMHLAMVNAHRDASPGVLAFLLESEGNKTVNMRDHEENLPIHLLNLGLKGLNLDEPDKLNNVADCLKLYLAAMPSASPDFLAALQDLPDWLQDVAVVSPHVRNILNKKIVQRFPTLILMLDGYMLLVVIIFFEIATTKHIDYRFDTARFGDDEDVEKLGSVTAVIFLYLGASYFLARELIQVVALWSLGTLTSWFYDTTNWLDMAVITLVFYYSILMTGDIQGKNLGWGDDQFRTGVAFTKGVLWTAVIYFLKSTQVDFAVFLGGVFYVVQRLVAFLLAVGVILLAFAQMFFIVYRQSEVCMEIDGNEGCNFPHCTFEDSLLKVSCGLFYFISFPN
jgi:ankyrin repeat protein